MTTTPDATRFPPAYVVRIRVRSVQLTSRRYTEAEATVVVRETLNSVHGDGTGFITFPGSEGPVYVRVREVSTVEALRVQPPRWNGAPTGGWSTAAVQQVP